MPGACGVLVGLLYCQNPNAFSSFSVKVLVLMYFVADLCDRAKADGARRAVLGVLAAGEAGLELAPEACGAPGR